MKEFIYKLIYKWYKNKDWREFNKNRLKNFDAQNSQSHKIKFKNSLEYNSKYLPESSREYFTYLKENIDHINKLNELELESLRSQKLYYGEHEIIVQFSYISQFKIIKTLDDYLSTYSIYNENFLKNLNSLLYVQFADKEIHKKYRPCHSNYPIHIANIRMVETESMRMMRLRSEVLDKILT